MTPKRTQPIWYKLATPEERSKIDALARSIADLRRRRQALVNRAKLRTDVWVQRHGGLARQARRKSAAG
jgi:hypothetical protein